MPAQNTDAGDKLGGKTVLKTGEAVAALVKVLRTAKLVDRLRLRVSETLARNSSTSTPSTRFFEDQRVGNGRAQVFVRVTMTFVNISNIIHDEYEDKIVKVVTER